MDVKNLYAEGSFVQDVGYIDYVKDGVLYTGAEANLVLVTAETD